MPSKSGALSMLGDGILCGSSKKNSSTTFPKYRSFVNGTDGRTPGTASTATKRSFKSFVIMSLVEGRGNARGEMGIASMDALCSDLSLCQFVDSASYARLRIQLQVLDPVEVVVPETTFEKGNNMNAVVELIKNSFPHIEVTTVSRRFFNDVKGAELVTQLASIESSNITPDVLSKYYCMAAAGALVKYVEFIQNVLFAQASLKVVYYAVEKACFIDVNTLRNLEVVERTRQTREPCRSLYSVLNTCLTVGGSRMLRSCLLQPSADPELISARCNVVEELVGNQAKLDRLRAIVKSACDVQQLVTVCCYIDGDEAVTLRSAEQKISQVLNLKQTLQLVESMKVALKSSTSELLKLCYSQLSDPRFSSIIELLNKTINPSAISSDRTSLAVRLNRCFAIQPGMHDMVDVSRKAYEELVHDCQQKAEEQKSGLVNARLAFSAQRGFHLTMPSSDPLTAFKLPRNFIQVVRNRASISFTTPELVKYNDRIDGIVSEILLGSNTVVVALLEEIRESIPCLYNAIEIVSLLDFFGSLAVYAMKVPTVRPIFSGANAMFVKNGRHPLLDIASDKVVPNDTHLSAETRLAIITGPNMAGKSTYLKQVCLLQILAQTGSFVPAEFAAFPLITRIFARIGLNDELANSLSAFAVEMGEMVPILTSSDSKTLVVMDELARSTSPEEGIALCHGVCEQLLEVKAFTMLATHFLDFASFAGSHAAVENFHFSANAVSVMEESGRQVEKLTSDHQLYKGPYQGPLYGLDVVELSTFPREVIENARKTAAELRAKSGVSTELDVATRNRRAILRFGYKLRSMLPVLEKAEPAATSNYLINLREMLLSDLSPSDSA